MEPSRLLRDRVLLLLVGIGAALRFWRIEGDLPYVFHYDEPTLVDNAVWLWQHQTLNPHFFHYPTGLIYLLAALYGVLMLGGAALGRFDGWNQALQFLGGGTYPRPPEGGVLYFYPTYGVPLLYLVGRCVSALAGTLTIVIVYLVAERCGRGRPLARTAALLVCLSPLAVEHSHLITTDSMATLAATIALVAAMQAKEGGTRRWTRAGAWSGLAAGIKYNAGIVALTLVALAAWRGRGDRLPALRPLLLAGGTALVVFLLTTPFALLDAPRFLGDLGYEMRRVGSITSSFAGAEAIEPSAASKIGEILWHNLGPAGILAVIVGVARALRSRRFAQVAILVWVVGALAPQLRWQSLYARYLLPPWPALLVLVALGVEGLAMGIDRLLPARLPRGPRFRGILAWSIPLLLVLWPGTVRLQARESARRFPDPRIEMTRWLDTEVPEGERIVLEIAGPFPSAAGHTLSKVDFLGRSTPDEYRSRGVRHLAGSGRERLIEGEEEFRDVSENLEAIRREADLVWSNGRYSIYRLRGGMSWEEGFEEALARADSVAARQILEEASSGEEATPYLWKRLGELRARQGDHSGARAALLEASARDTSDVEPLLALGNLALERADWDEALDRFLLVGRISPWDPLVSHNLAVTLLYRAQEKLRRGDRAGALEDWMAAREHALATARRAPAESNLREIQGQVERMGVRWGFAP